MDFLYVPIAVEVFLTNHKNTPEKYIADIAPDFSLLEFTKIGSNLETGPFSTKRPLKEGAHLHFILPDALTQGMQKEEELAYPAVPNRFLVTRMVAGEKVSCFSWLIESDYLAGKRESFMVDSPSVPMLSGEGKGFRYLGRSYPASEAVKEGGERLQPLTALGYGEPAFAAFYPGCRNVFGFHDSLSDVSGGMLTYSVIGWYSREKDDPLYGAAEEDFEQRLQKLAWSVPKGTLCKNRILCHGMVSDIDWKGPDAEYPSGKSLKDVKPAMGTTSAEALSAVLSRQIWKEPGEGRETMERFLTALQYDILDEMKEIDGIVKCQDSIHKNELLSRNGGEYWVVRRSDKKAETEPQLKKGVKDELKRLNEFQEAADATKREIASYQARLQDAWDFYQKCVEEGQQWQGPSSEAIMERMKKVVLCIIEKRKQLKNKLEEIRNQVEKTRKLIEQEKGYFLLETAENDRFYEPGEPVILLAGEGAGRGFLFGEDGRFEKNNSLACRERMINSLTGIRNGKDVSLSKEEILSCLVISQPEAAERKTLTDALCEAACLSPSVRKVIAGITNTEQLQPAGELPSPLSFSLWEQPWVNLYLEWEADYFPATTSREQDAALKDWKLGEIDYDYEKECSASGRRYSGRTVLTQNPPYHLYSMIEKYAKRFKDDPEIKEYLEQTMNYVKKLNILSQNLSGFLTQLLSRKQSYGISRTLLWDKDPVAVMLDHYVGTEAFQEVQPEKELFPVQGGFLRLVDMSCINTFGQIQTLTSYRDEMVVSEQCLPLPQNHAAGCGVLRPRFVHPSRICFRWMSALEAGMEACIDQESWPVCGIMIPNLLNRGLLVYDRDGSWKGTLKLAHRKEGIKAAWVSAPWTGITKFSQETFLSEDLKCFLQELAEPEQAKKGSLEELLEIIDNRLAHIFSQGGSYSQDLSVLWGRPLVLAKAQLTFELYGLCAVSQAYEDFGKDDTHQLERTEIEVKLGDTSRLLDGMLVYFPNRKEGKTDYSLCCPAAGTEKAGKQSGYVDYRNSLRMDSSEKSGLSLTLLMEASSPVTIRTGMHPARQVSIPPEYMKAALEKIQMAFEINPILTPEDDITVPVSAGQDTAFFWVNKTKGTECRIQEEISVPPEVYFSDSNLLADGYLALKKKEAGSEGNR